MLRILDRYIYKELIPPFTIGVGVFTFFLVIDRIYQLTDLVITKSVPLGLVLPLLIYMLPSFLGLTLPMALLVAVLLVTARLTLFVNPWSTGAFQGQLFKILQSRAATGIKERTFSASFGQFVIYVEEVSASQVGLRDILVSDERNPQKTRIVLAREGRLLTDEAN